MSNLTDIQTEIEKLQKPANDKAREFDKTVLEIFAKMQAFGITTKDLQGKGRSRKFGKSGAAPGKKAASKTPAKKSGAALAAKYPGPDRQTWRERGLTPRWLSSLQAEGRKTEISL